MELSYTPREARDHMASDDPKVVLPNTPLITCVADVHVFFSTLGQV